MPQPPPAITRWVTSASYMYTQWGRITGIEWCRRETARYNRVRKRPVSWRREYRPPRGKAVVRTRLAGAECAIDRVPED